MNVHLTRPLSALLLLALLGKASANQTAVHRIETAQASLIVFLPTVRSFDVSDALRKAALRGRQVVVITTPAAAQDPKSYLLKLAHVPGVTTYLVNSTGLPFMLADSTSALAGAGLSVQGQAVRDVASASLSTWVRQVMTGRPVAPLDLLKVRYQIKS